jgi:hypothetical protein
MTGHCDHNILPRIIALLLSLAMLAERAASRPLAVRFYMCRLFLPAQYAALTLMDFPDDGDLTQTLHEMPDLSVTGGGVDTLLHLALVFRAVAAVLMHACLTGGTPRSLMPRYALALSVKRPAQPVRRLPNRIGVVHDTS